MPVASSASTSDSTNSCVMIRARLAPSAERTASSLTRVAVRARIIVPTFPHATKSKALYDFSGVAEAAVVAIPDEEISNRIRAFVVLTESGACEEKQLQKYCRSRLPHYMVPESIAVLGNLPKTATGKIDKQSLIRDCRGAAPGRDSGPG